MHELQGQCSRRESGSGRTLRTINLLHYFKKNNSPSHDFFSRLKGIPKDITWSHSRFKCFFSLFTKRIHSVTKPYTFKFDLKEPTSCSTASQERRRHPKVVLNGMKQMTVVRCLQVIGCSCMICILIVLDTYFKISKYDFKQEKASFVTEILEFR